MRITKSTDALQRFWLTPVIMGVALIVLSVLLVNHPELLAYFVAALFMLAGCALIAFGWSMRKRVTIRRIDEARPPGDDQYAP